ncbi:hypothetical protein [Vibrio amylolyticus]|nr:hypothetical protein [Vibrio amylolyticus]
MAHSDGAGFEPVVCAHSIENVMMMGSVSSPWSRQYSEQGG